jgi:hypothetical protein
LASIIFRRRGSGAVIRKVEAGAAAASTRLYSPLLRCHRRRQMTQKQGLLIRMHRNFGDFYLDYDYFNHHEILH